MSEVWNSWDLKPPPMCTVKMVLHLKEMKNLAELAVEASTTLSNLNYLNREAAILSRLLYKNKRMFRHDKGFQNLAKIYQSLKRYLRLNLSGVLKTFKASLSKSFHPGATHAYLPNRQMLKWVLLRLLPFSQIFKRLIEICKDTGSYLYKKLHLGWQLNLTLTLYSLTARILVSSKFLLMKSIEWYDSLYRYLPYLEETIEFLPEFTLPGNLKKWLGEVDISPLKKKTSVDEMFEMINMPEDDVDIGIISENLSRYFGMEAKEDSDIEKVENQQKQISGHAVEDLGVSVRDEQKEKVKELKVRKKGKKRKSGMLLKKVKKEMEAEGRKRKKM